MKTFFNIISGKDGFFVSHPENGAKGSCEKGTSKAGNGILVLRLEISSAVYKGVLNKTTPEKLAGNPKLPTVWGGVEDSAGNKFKVAGWWTTHKKNGELCKMPYFSCSLEEEKEQSDSSDSAEPSTPAPSGGHEFENIPF